MSAPKLVDTIVSDILNSISIGDLVPGQALGSEAEVGVSYGVSRLTIREAFRVLRSQGVLKSAQGLGTFVTPVSEWTSLHAIVTVLSERSGPFESAMYLLDVRRMLETGAAEQAATRRSSEDVSRLLKEIELMKDAHRHGDIQSFVDADLDFHEILLKATKNPLVPAMMHQVSQLLIQNRRMTASVVSIREHAIEHHERIAREVETGNPTGAREAMDAHLLQTTEELAAENAEDG